MAPSTPPSLITTLPLVERDAELELLDRLLAEARAGRGVAAFVEGPAGQGKTTLLRALRERAAAAGFRVLHASGAEIDRDFAFGLVRQLFELPLLQAEGERRERLLDGPARLAETVFHDAGGDPGGGTDVAHMRRHAIYWLAANLAEEAPLLLSVDDAHWGDAPSLRALDVIARRIADLPVLLAVGARPGEPGAEHDLLDGIASGPATEAVRLAPLSPPAVARLLEEALGASPEPAFLDAAVHTSGGNPLMVRELVRTLAAERFTGAAGEAGAVRRAVPGTITRAVLSRLRRLSPEALALARSLAVLAERPRLDVVAALAGIEREALGQEHETLVRMGLLDAEMGFVHPMVREAVLGDLIGGERALWHRRAAYMLHDSGAPADRVAPHLLHAEPEGVDWVAPLLLETGRRALASGAPDVAVRHLERALAEPPGEDILSSVLLALGRAELATGAPEALAHLSRAAAAPDVRVAAAAERARAGLLIMADRREELADGLRGAIARAERDDPPLALELREDLLNAIQYDPRSLRERRGILDRAEAEGPAPLLAHVALDRALAGAPADTVLALARRALADGELVRTRGAEGSTVHHVLEALMLAEAAADAAALLDAAADDARRRGSRLAAAYVSAGRTQWERAFGDLRRAEDEARRALELFRAPGVTPGTHPTLPALAAAMLDRGDLDGAEEALNRLPHDPARAPRGLYVRSIVLRAGLRLAQGRPDEAVAALERQLALEDERGWVTSPRDDTRSLYVTALAAAGRAEEALAAADLAVEIARRRGVHGPEAAALLARARAEAPAQVQAVLERAVECAERSPSPHLQGRALAELGAHLRRTGQRVACRDPLARARQLAHACGATALEARVHEELIVAGARPKRVALSGVDALTAAERRVAELAVQGLRNRDIAAELFVTLKTVEVHLGSTYAKLGIRGRPQLAEALAAGAEQ